MVCGEEQQKEIATIKPRDLQLKLSDADVRRLAKMAARAELSVEELLESFIGDLVDGTYSNGSDERERANSWFERCGYDCYNNYSFLHYLIDEYLIDEFVDAWENAQSYQDDVTDTEKEIANPKKNWNDYTKGDGTPYYNSKEEYIADIKGELEDFKEELKNALDEIEEYWNAYLKWTSEKDIDKDKEIKAVLEWNSKYAVEEE